MAWLRENVPALGGLYDLKAFLERTLASLEADQQRLVGVSVQGNVQILTCTGTPEGQIEAVVGSLALRTDGGAGTTLYVKETGTGATGWVGK